MLAPDHIQTLLDPLLGAYPQVARFEVRRGFDHSDELAIWVYVVVHDDREVELRPAWDTLRFQIKDRVRDELRKTEAGNAPSEMFVYVRLWSLSETLAAEAHSA